MYIIVYLDFIQLLVVASSNVTMILEGETETNEIPRGIFDFPNTLIVIPVFSFIIFLHKYIYIYVSMK